MKSNDISENRGNGKDENAFIDFLISIGVMIVGVGAAVASILYWREQGLPFYASAGFMPSLMGVVLVLLGLKLFSESVKGSTVKGRIVEVRKALAAAMKKKSTYKAFAGLAIFVVYIYLLLGRVSFPISSFLVLWSILLLNKFDRTWKSALVTGLISLGSVLFIVLIFSTAFHVPMP